MSAKWRTKARAEGRVCPECAQPVSRKHWQLMQRKNGSVGKCLTCLYVHWETPLRAAGGSARRDNADRDALDAIRISASQ